jgi:hypothetical protein
MPTGWDNTLDWSTKRFKPQRSYEKGSNTATPTNIQKTASTLGKNWSANWKMQKDNRLAISKQSSIGNSIETIWSQLTMQQQENKHLLEQNQRMREEAEHKAQQFATQLKDIEIKWKSHVDNETTA